MENISDDNNYMLEFSDDEVWNLLPTYIYPISNLYNYIFKLFYDWKSFKFYLIVLSGYFGKRNREYLLKHNYINFGYFRNKIKNFEPKYENKIDDLNNFFNQIGIPKDGSYLYNLNTSIYNILPKLG